MNILLDLDGTLTDPHEGILGCIRHALVAMGKPVPADAVLERYIGPPLREAFREILPGSDDGAIEVAVDSYRQRFATVGLYENRVYDGILQAVQLLFASGAELFVATSKPTCFAEQILEYFELAQYIRAVHGSELDGARSDKRELIHYVLDAECLRPASTVMVGDRRQDVLGAIHNAVFPVGVLWGYGSSLELVEAGAKMLLREPTELESILGAPTGHSTA